MECNAEVPTLILAALYLFEQILAQSKCKSNSTIQLLINTFKFLSTQRISKDPGVAGNTP